MMSHVIYMIREAPTDPLGLSHLCKFSLGVSVLAYVKNFSLGTAQQGT